MPRPIDPWAVDEPTRGLTEDIGGSDDLLVFQSALRVLKSVRADMSSTQPKVAGAANRRVGFVIAYLLGYLDSQGVRRDATTSGLDDIIGTQQATSLIEIADDLIHTIEQLLAAPPTRAINVKHAIGAALVTAGALVMALM